MTCFQLEIGDDAKACDALSTADLPSRLILLLRVLRIHPMIVTMAPRWALAVGV
jgi:hypothetical protein